MLYRRTYSTFLLVLTVCGIFFYSVSVLSSPRIIVKQTPDVLSNWNDCFELDFNARADQFWAQFLGESGKCEYRSSELHSFLNHDEAKLAFLPKKSSKIPEIVVTLGVGQDIAAELHLKKTLSNRSIFANFYGADPMFLDNSKLFETIGDYFPLAVGDSNGIVVASVLSPTGGQYVNEKKYHVEMIDYLTKFANISHIDHLWMDNEYAEYGLFPYFYKGGAFEKAGIIICQLNMEVHVPKMEHMEKFKAFVKQIMEDNQWAFLKNVNVGHYRLFMFNFGSDYCVEKYLHD